MKGSDAWALISALVVLAGLTTVAAADAPTKYPYTVTCTTGMVADIVQQVAGGKGEVSNIIGAGVDPHLYSATRNDVAIFDQTSFSKYVVAGPEALAGLQWVCAADVDVPVVVPDIVPDVLELEAVVVAEVATAEVASQEPPRSRQAGRVKAAPRTITSTL